MRRFHALCSVLSRASRYVSILRTYSHLCSLTPPTHKHPPPAHKHPALLYLRTKLQPTGRRAQLTHLADPADGALVLGLIL